MLVIDVKNPSIHILFLATGLCTCYALTNLSYIPIKIPKFVCVHKCLFQDRLDFIIPKLVLVLL